MAEIKNIHAMEILDSRGNPTLSVKVTLSDGSVGEASCPAGASRGKWEAHELRDRENPRYHRMGVSEAVRRVNEIIFPALVGMKSTELEEADSFMIALDGAYNKSNLGANSIISTSAAIARAVASSLSLPLYRYLGGAFVKKMPIPMMNVLNGGAHSDNNLDIQEFMIVPHGAESFTEAVRISSEVYHTLGNILKSRSLSAALGDEGGYAPHLENDEEGIELLLLAIENSGYKPGADISIALDVAASEWYSEGMYYMPKRGKRLTSDELSDYFISLIEKYPIMSIEDPLGEEDYSAWEKLTARLAARGVNLVGDDLFVTNTSRIAEGIRRKMANTVLIKPNQIGTLTETYEAVSLAVSGGYKTIMSHRSGETEDSFIADLAVGLSCDYVKMGAPARGERTAKYNRLMKIEAELFSPNYGNQL